MKPVRLIFRSLLYYWRTNLPVVAGIAIAVAVMTGALMVGRSVRGSLRDLLFERIGRTETVVTAERFFSQSLADQIPEVFSSCPIIYLQGTLLHEESRVRMHRVNVYGIDDRFWKFQGMPAQPFTDDRAALVGSTLARQMDIKTGNGLLLQVETQQSIPREWLYGRRDDIGKTVRLSCSQILAPEQLGDFALRPHQGNVYSLFVPIGRLQKDLNQESKANTILLSGMQETATASVNDILKKNLSPGDLGLRLKQTPSGKGFLLESDRILIEDPVAKAALEAAGEAGLPASPIYTYMANAIRANGRSIPYSAIAAADIGNGALTDIVMKGTTGTVQSDSDIPPIYLTDWAAGDLKASPGDTVAVEYYIWLEAGNLVTRSESFRLSGVVATAGDVNAALAPEIPGVTEAGSMSDWDPPFPLDLKRIREKDESYWDRYRATPKAFVPLSVGQRLWQNRFGKRTSILFLNNTGSDVKTAQATFSRSLLSRLRPESAGLKAHPVKESGMTASHGSTDFAEYFVYFSFFLIVSAILLAFLFFKLTIEQRVREIGLLKVVGIDSGPLRRLFFREGLVLSLVGCILGLFLSLGYGWLMVYGLRTWWVDAVGTDRMTLHFSPLDMAFGTAIGLCVSLATVFWTLRGLKRNTPRALLSGVLESVKVQSRRARTMGIVAIASTATALLLLAAATLGMVSQLIGFFVAGFLSLVAVLCAAAYYLRRSPARTISGTGWPALIQLGARNARHRPGRSVLCAALIASATFIIVSTEAFRRAPDEISLEPDSGTGGYRFIAESTLPVVHDLNSTEGREALGILRSQDPAAGTVRFVSFRERPGDDTSCLNLYTPQEPRILGAPDSFLRSVRFSFKSSLASTPEEEENPWLLLDKVFSDGAIAAIADANTIQYILHLSLGGDIPVQADDGSTVRLRLAAALNDSTFQGGILISEKNFLRVFPDREGYRYFLVDTPRDVDASTVQSLKENLGYWGIRLESSGDLLASYHRVENTYLSTFQSLGTLGLILGTFGLATVLLRNVLERRSELALLRAAGYRRHILSGIILFENILLLLWGAGSGIVCALISIAPVLHSRGETPPFLMVAMVLIPVLIAGTAASLVAVIAVFRSPLLPALRSE
ncbi:MAG: FtsX-like permease family protein [Acidobacteria bacterium]|nr:FtsX-like permease family protein [Acidobacteriota bacterium]